MQPISKKMKRLERKKKKLAALIEITEMNNKDRVELNSSPLQQLDDQLEMDVKDDSVSKNCTKDRISHLKSNSDTLFDTNDVGKQRKHKKKRKSKHQEDDDSDNIEKQKPKIDDNISNSESYSHKRKSSFESDIQKERPWKIIKRYSEEVPSTAPHNNIYQISSSFADELKSLKKDIERNKRKKEKRSRLKEPRSDKEDGNIGAGCEGKATEKVLKSHSGQGYEISINDEEIADKNIEDDEVAELQKLVKERKKQLKDIPSVRLKSVGKEADLELVQRLPILPHDVQHLLLLSQLGHDCPEFPRWLEMKKFNRLCKTVVLVVEGASAYDYCSQESNCPTIQKMEVKAEMLNPDTYNANVVEELCAVPLTRQQKKDLEKKFGKEICVEALSDKVIKVLRSAFSISSVPKMQVGEEVERKIILPPTDKFSRTELLLSVHQLIFEGYPLPYDGCSGLGNRYPDYVMTKDLYQEVTPSSPMWALDCEMCLTQAGNELTRVSVVNEQHQTVFESFCMPRNPIINYLTEYSGITREMLVGVTTRLEDIQQQLRQLFPPDVILVGQSLSSDFHALKMMHPYVIDTSVVFNLTGIRRHKSKLSALTMRFLNEAIQQRGKEGHDSVEDSLAALKLIQHKLTKSIEYGDAVLSPLAYSAPTSRDTSSTPTSAKNSTKHQADDPNDINVEVSSTMAISLFKHIAMRKKTITFVGQEEIIAQYSTFVAAAKRENKQLTQMQTTNSNEETIQIICRECKKSNFTMAHLVLGDEDNITMVDSWVKNVFDSPPFNSLIVLVLTGGHANNTNGACFVTIKKPRMKLKSRKAD